MEEVPSTSLRKDDLVVVVAGQRIPGDGDVIEGVASVDESAVTGESAPVEVGPGDEVVVPFRPFEIVTLALPRA